MDASSSSKKVVLTSHLIPDDTIIDEILTRLPVKSLCRFKSISKQWRFIISSQRFVKLHLLLYSPNFPRIMLGSFPYERVMRHCSTHSLFSENRVTEAIQTDFIESENDKMIIASFNGLLCIFVGNFQHSYDFFIWNPSSRKHLQLPSPNVDVNIHWPEFCFGYDQSNDDYVILFISILEVGEYDYDDSHSMLYRSRTNSWKRIRDFDLYPGGIPAYTSYCKFVAGKFHIPICPEGSYDVEFHQAVIFDIISFDFETEEYAVIKHPEYGADVQEISLELLGGSLCVLCNKETQADLWVMKEYGDVESWTKTVILRLDMICYSKALTMSQYRDMLLLVKVSGVYENQHRFVVYDMTRNNHRVPEISNVGYIGEADVYVESLVWINEEEWKPRADPVLQG